MTADKKAQVGVSSEHNVIQTTSEEEVNAAFLEEPQITSEEEIVTIGDKVIVHESIIVD